MSGRCRHGRAICSECVTVTDAGKRMSDGINAMIAFTKLEERSHKWVAVTLADGSVDSALYPSKTQAASHQSNEFRCCYIPLDNFQGGITARDAQVVLDLHRHLYDNGARIADPDETALIMPLGREQRITRRLN